MAEHEYIAAPQPDQARPAQVTSQPLLVAEVVTQIQLGGSKTQPAQIGQLVLDPGAAHVSWRLIQCVRDDHRTATALAGQGYQVLRVVAQPERPQVEPHRGLRSAHLGTSRPYS